MHEASELPICNVWSDNVFAEMIGDILYFR